MHQPFSRLGTGSRPDCCIPRRAPHIVGACAAALLTAVLLCGHGVALAATEAPAPSGASVAADAQAIHVVYHLSEGLEQASRALGNIRNHLIGDPTVHIVVVAHGPGIDFLLDGARDAHGNPYDISIQELAQKGVEFRACNNTLKARNIDRSRLVPEATVVPAGVVEVTRLQAREGYAYLHP